MSYTTSGSNAIKKEMIYIPALDKTEEKIKVAGYARVSSNSSDQLNSFSAQVTHYTRLIESNPSYELVGLYADEGISGVKTEKRTDFLRMMEDARNGKIDRIITKSLSRFSRNMLDGVAALRELKLLGISVIFEKEGINTEKLTSENLLTLYSLLAEQESLSISKNVKKGNRARMSIGEYVSSTPPFGYRLVNKKLIIEDSEAEIVKRIFREYLSGIGPLRIAKNLNEEGVLKKDKKFNWRKENIKIILKNERYVGDMLFQKTYSEDTIPYKKRINSGNLPQYYVSNTHDSIISKVEFEIVKMIINNKKIYNREKTEIFLNKKLNCKCCGVKLRRKESNNIYYWICRNKDMSLTNICNGKRLSEDAVLDTIINFYNKLKQNYKTILLPMVNQLVRLEEKKYSKNSNISDINKKIAELLEQNHTLSGLRENGILTSAIFISKTDEINNKVQKLKQEKYRILHSKDSGGMLEKTNELIEILENAEDYITEMDEEVFTDIIEKITVDDSEILKFHLINGLVLEERIIK